jgi:hypothetical protein
MSRTKLAIGLGVVVATIAVLGWQIQPTTEAGDVKQAGDAEQKDAALERTRRMVRMLDDIYKTTVVLITDKYVNDEDDFPAGSAAIALFDAIKKKGWHEVRLLDATGDPYNDKNTARDDFDREAIRQLKS